MWSSLGYANLGIRKVMKWSPCEDREEDTHRGCVETMKRRGVNEWEYEHKNEWLR